ncbi:MAG: tRNA 2-thiouridine(34) synthase MnmA [Methylococcales bacterium]|nr:tRNA 2-thiouridine(34) synthase MnmA [Methylococcales bacterium]
MTEHIIIGMSGGVDSSVAALTLLEHGYQVSGLFMKNWEEDDGTEYCTAQQDLDDARQVCDKLSIPLHTINFAAEYWDEVFEVFLAEYRAGRTPNPDILCNLHIKFRAFLDHALEDLGGTRIATGHYARVHEQNGGFQLLKGLDGNKDQTYFIYTLGQTELSKTLFPIGHLPKPEVRALAEKAGFVTSRKKDSTGICFIGERKFRDFLKRYLPAQPGAIVTLDGRQLGEHQGLMYYTLGQRQGLAIGGVKEATEAPWFVIDKDLANNRLIIGQGHDHPALLHCHLIARQLFWVDRAPLTQPLHCAAKTRYRQPDQPCQVEPVGEDAIKVSFEQPQRAITPGQSVVFYQGEMCLGGGIIESRY